MKRVVFAHIFWLFTYLSLPVHAIGFVTYGAQASIAEAKLSQGDSSENMAEEEAAPLTQLGSEFHNSIKLLQNRFRIDYEVEEITMIFFREYGSAPIVLVQPDGSKIFQSSANGEDIFWFDTSTYDMISIKNPTPGPWQAVGQIKPESRVMVISNLSLHAEPLPSIIFSGEILKQTAYLTNDGVPIDYKAFRDVVELTISLSSTNNPNYNNFGANTQTVASFEDNGKGMDERPLDGVFTGQFNLSVADGEWVPTFTVSTPMYSREQVDPNIMLYANPIKVSVELDGGGDGYHKLKVDAEREHVDMSTLLIDGKVRFPNGDIQNFSITDMSADVREYLIVNYEYGVYTAKLTAYGNTVDGREFILDVPEYSFLSKEPEPEVAAVAEGQATQPDASGESQKQQVLNQDEPIKEEKMSKGLLWSLIIGINLFVLLVGGSLIWFLVQGKRLSVNFKIKEKTADDQTEEKKPGFFSRLFKRKSKEPQEAEPKDTPPESENGFIDLSIPKE